MSFLYGIRVGMGEELQHCIDECVALVNIFWRNYNGPLLFPLAVDIQHLLSMSREAGAWRHFGTKTLTICWAGCDIAGAVDGPLASAVPAVVSRSWVIAVTISKLNSSATGTRALSPGSPGPPVTMAWSLKHVEQWEVRISSKYE